MAFHKPPITLRDVCVLPGERSPPSLPDEVLGADENITGLIIYVQLTGQTEDESGVSVCSSWTCSITETSDLTEHFTDLTEAGEETESDL